jgi:quercetin dioxygenase-like cupin family protein
MEVIVEFIKSDEVKTFVNDGFASEQLIFPENSDSERITITKVTVQPKAINSRHVHKTSEQIWIAVKGKGLLLLNDDKTKVFEKGDIVRFADGDVHGLENESDDIFQYISVTSPPINFRKAYKGEKK